MKKIFFTSVLVLIFSFSFSQKNKRDLDFIKNIGQWEKKIQYKSNIKGGRVFFHANSLTYDIYNLKDLEHHHKEEKESHENEMVNCFAYRVNFLNSNETVYEGKDKQSYYHNYLLGKDESKWASFVPLFKSLEGKNIYNNIDIKTYSEAYNFKYDFTVHSGGNVNDVKLQFEGLEAINVVDGNLILKTSFNEVVEQKPYVYQIINGEKTVIDASYILIDNIVMYSIESYNKEYDLIIDPVVVASTYSGSTEQIYGHTATFDDVGNIYSGGAGFSPGGFPVTTGAYQTAYAGSRDMCINKYNVSGTSLIYATYLGGSLEDYPHSLFDYNGNLYILGISASSNFPTTNTAYDQTSNGDFDIVVSILNSTGSGLIGSTYVGGANDDGLNAISTNYGDDYRGEIVVDNNGNCYVSSVTESGNFPISSGAYQSTIGGDQDGIVFKLNSDVSNLVYSTFLGGPNDDAAYGVKVNGSKTYVSGVAATGFLPSMSGAFPNYFGGNDGFLIALDATASNIVGATYFGSSANEEAFFVEIDINDDVYILGQSSGNAITATAGKYSGGTGTFIAKFTNDLTTNLYVTTTAEMVPVAFLVDDCGYIYASGHGEVSALNGFTVTSDAFQSSPAGFYLMVLGADATVLNFGTYYGSPTSHVDGGTSRFSKNGVVYQATCTNAGFPTLPGAHGTATQSGTYDVTVFKIDFGFGASAPNFGPFPNDEDFVFEANGCFDVVAFGSGSFSIEIQSDAFPLGATVSLPTANTNGTYDFSYFDTNTRVLTNLNNVDVIQTSPTVFEGVGNAGARFCWTPDECEVLSKDTFNIVLLGIAVSCDSTKDTLTRNLKLVVERGDYSSIVPNVFSPNNDGKNDKFNLQKSQHDRCYDALTAQIFNRWGQLVFESDDPLFEWNGKNLKGEKVASGTYYVILQGFFGGKEVTDQFPVTVFR